MDTLPHGYHVTHAPDGWRVYFGPQLLWTWSTQDQALAYALAHDRHRRADATAHC